jgi:hypothetical protein
MHKYLYSPVSFAAEYQNEPLINETALEGLLTVEEISHKTCKFVRRRMPSEIHTLVAMIDVQKKALYYSVVGLGNGFTGIVTDYGIYPDQKAHYYTLAAIRGTLQRKYPGQGFEATLRLGLQDLTKTLQETRWHIDNGQELQLSIGLIDAAWGESTEIVRKFCRDNRGIWYPSFGRGIGATSAPINSTSSGKRKPGEKRGMNWKLGYGPVTGVREVQYDANFFKSFLHERFCQAAGTSGSLELFEGTSSRHRMLAEHMHAEIPSDVLVEKGLRAGSKKRQWILRPERPDNHLFDCLAGCCVAGMMSGIKLDSHEQSKYAIVSQHTGQRRPEKRKSRRRR